MEAKNLVCVKVYFDPGEFAEVVRDAEEAGIRRKGLKLRVQKPHGFAGEGIANTKGVSKFLKHTLQNWRDTKEERAVKKAEIERRMKELQQEAARLGINR